MATPAYPGSILRSALTFMATGLLLVAIPVNAADEWNLARPIHVLLADGRKVTGTVQMRTDEVHLWLESQTDGAFLSSRFPWPSIAAAWLGETQLDINRLRAQALVLPKRVAEKPADVWDDLPPPFPIDNHRHSVGRPLPQAAPIQSLHIEARLANWDADALPDGLLVTIFPRTALGDWASVRGNLDLTLFGEVWPQPEHPHRYPRAGFQELARASHLVREVDFAQGPAKFRLTFSTVHPETVPQIATYGIVQARLGVVGQGIFEAAEPFQRLREASPTRDRLQLFRGQRSFPIQNHFRWQ